MTHLTFSGFSFLINDFNKTLTEIHTGTSKSHAKQRAAFIAAEAFRRDPTKQNAARFSEAVFVWGGPRTYGKLTPKLDAWNEHVFQWLSTQAECSPREIIACGIFEGVGVSYASKHLRIIEPTKYATLDSVLERELGYARNPSGYARFINDLLEFKEQAHIKAPLGDIEQAIYELIQARSKKKIVQ